MTITVDPEGWNIGVRKPTDAIKVVKALNAAAEIPLEEKAIAVVEKDRLLDDYPDLKRIILDPSISAIERKLRAHSILKKCQVEMEQKKKRHAEVQAQLDYCEIFIKGHEQYNEWRSVKPVLQRNDCSRLHNLIDCLCDQKNYMEDALRGIDPKKFPWDELQPFVVQHDWAAAFKNATDYNDGPYKLPYEMCAFEFRISDRSIIVLSNETADGSVNHRFYVAANGVWVTPHEDDGPIPNAPHFVDFAISQIKAICIALDAEVAERELVRSSEKVNAKRKAQDKTPFFSYHVVSLARRVRALPAPHAGVPYKRRRLHFRRGHWRHYEKFKTWVRWCLVGDPELGFIDKEYRL